MEKQTHTQRLIDSPEVRSSCISTIASLFFHTTNDAENGNNATISDTSDDESFTLNNPDISEKAGAEVGAEAEAETELDKHNSDRLFTCTSTTARLRSLRALMSANNLSAYIIPSEDAHQSEYTALGDQRRQWISGFTGSSGIAIVTMKSAALSTDSRYFLQAEQQLDENWTLLKQGVPQWPSWQKWMLDECVWLMDKCGESGDIGVDPRLITWNMGKDLIRQCHVNNLRLINDLDDNLIDFIMPKPRIKPCEVFVHDVKYSGRDVLGKLEDVRKLMKETHAKVYVCSMLDSIAWLFNLRGSDIEFNPVFFAYAIITMNSVVLYIDKRKIIDVVHDHLHKAHVDVRPYTQIWDDLPGLAVKQGQDDIVVVDKSCSYSVYVNIPAVCDITVRSLVTELKGIKNPVEIENLRISQKEDSIAIIRFLAWFEEICEQKASSSSSSSSSSTHHESLNELDVVDKLYEFRGKSCKFKGLSFATIAASGANAAIVHYEPTSDVYSPIEYDNVLLLDSGGQYLEGTTDITRTIYVKRHKSATAEMKRAYSLVLAGHLQVAMLKFRKGTSSYYIDGLARAPLRRYGMEYGHGTGHGIDNYICVHAGPCGLSPSETGYNYKPLEVGNFISDEPGYYEAGRYGIRIESDVLVRGTGNGEEEELEFEYMTMVPFCHDLVDVKYLTGDQIKWVNAFHKSVRERLEMTLRDMGDNRAADWLLKVTREW